jgi:type IV pilus assembly protein PilC
MTKAAAQILSPTRPVAAARHGLADDLRRFALDLAWPIVADRRLAEQILFYRQLGTLVKAGIPIIEAIRLREERANPGPLKAILRETLHHLEQGGRISEVFALHPETIPPFQVAVLYAGEAGGTLDEALERIADCLEAEQRLRRFINRNTTYTKILFVVAQFVIPAFFAFVFGGSVIGVLWTSLVALFWTAMVICFTFAAIRSATARSPELALVLERIKWALPAVGRVAREFALCRFGRALGTLYAAGVPLQSALRLSGAASGSRQVARAAEEMAGYVSHGVALGEACLATAFFPLRTVEMMSTGAESGSVDTMMLKMADYLEDEAETRAHQVGFFAAQAFYLIVALYVTGMLGMAGGALIGAFVRRG